MKKLLLAAAALSVVVSTEAPAFDLMHPFWGPAKNQFASETSYSFERSNYGIDKIPYGENYYAQQLAEKVLYGITDNWTVFGSLARGWDKSNGDDHYKTDSWSLGTSFNFINDGKNFLQGAFTYQQSKDSDGGKLGKVYTIEGTYGYNFDSVTPYAKVRYLNSANWGADNDAMLGVFVGAYKKLSDKVGATLGLDYYHLTSSYTKSTYTLQADTSYMLTKDVVLKVFGNYLLDQKTKDYAWSEKQGFGLGASVKVAF